MKDDGKGIGNAAGRGSELALGYRAILRLDNSENAVKIASDQVRSWLKSKHRDHHRHGKLNSFDWNGPGTHVMGPDAQLTVIEHAGDDSSNRLLLRLDEKNPSGTWRVDVIASSLPQGGEAKQLIVVEVHTDAAAAGGRPVSHTTNPPNVVRSLLEVTTARDFHADVRLTPSPTVVDADEVAHLAEALLDPRRSTSIVVAGAVPSAPIPMWSKIVGDLVRNSAGTTASFVLTGAAQERLNIMLTASHGLVNGAVRTFLPGVIPADTADALRHRILYPGSLADSIIEGMRVRDSLARVHAAAARRQIIERPLPHEVARTARILEREELRGLSATSLSVLAAPAPPIEDGAGGPELEAQARPLKDKAAAAATPKRPPLHTSPVPAQFAGALMRLFESHTGSRELTVENISTLEQVLRGATRAAEVHAGKIDALLDTLNLVRDERDALKQDQEQAEYELALEAEERRREAHQRRRLERLVEFQANRLKSLHDFDVFVDPEDGLDETPGSMFDMLERLQAEERVARFIQFTGDLDTALDLQIYDSLGRYAATFWEYILVMRDYCLEKIEHDFAGSLFTYLSSDQTRGRKCDPKRFAPTESESVKANPKWRSERLLPVPAVVDPSSKTLMLAHFKTTVKDGVAPRMHVHDDTSGTGKIYIGYIGKHLSNTMTN